MKKSKLIKFKFSEYLNKEELKYRETIQLQEDEFKDTSNWIERINDERRHIILPFLYRNVDFKGEILELGAGSCWFGSELSRLDSVSKIYCVEMSEFILKNVAPHVMEHIGANTEKLTRVIGDFNQLDFQDEKFDYVVFDASLHHVPEDSFLRVLKEVHRVLKSDGKVVAIREPFLRTITIKKENNRRKFGQHEKTYGVTENIYSKREWKSMLSKAGFKCHFIPTALQIDDTLSLRNLIRKLIIYSPLRIPFFNVYPDCIIVLEKYPELNTK